MRPRRSLQRTILLIAFVTLAVFSITALAQDDDDNSSGDNTPAPTTNNNTQRPSNTAQPAPSNTADNNNDDNNDDEDNKDNEKSTENPPPTTRNSPSPSNNPAVITGVSATDDGALTAAPSLTRGPKTTTYPPPSPPPVADAPFMHRSSAPEGTVFIAVGAILGAFGLAVLAWRGIIACLLHRSVERAAAAQHAANDKAALFVPPSAPFYQQAAHSASGSRLRNDSPGPAMGAPSGTLTPGAPGTGVRRTNRNATPSATPSMINLFYSPTATANAPTSAGPAAGGDRTSRYLPSGFYPAPTGSTTNLHSPSADSPRVASGVWNQHHANSSRHTLNPSPPDSPLPYPNPHPHPHHLSSTSSLGLHSHPGMTQPSSPGVRAPSAFLDDLLAENPNALPPPVMPAQRGHGRNSSHGSGR